MKRRQFTRRVDYGRFPGAADREWHARRLFDLAGQFELRAMLRDGEDEPARDELQAMARATRKLARDVALARAWRVAGHAGEP